MPNNELINVTRLGFFKRIRKAFLMRRINVAKYKNAPQFLQNDSDVIERLMIKSPWNLRYLSQNNALDYLKVHPEVIAKSPKELRDSYLEKMPELFKSLAENQKLAHIFFDKKYEFFKELPKEKQKEFLMREISTFLSIDQGLPYLSSDIYFNLSTSFNTSNHSEGNLITTPAFFFDKLYILDENALFEVVYMYSKDYDEKIFYSDEKKYYEAEKFFRKIRIDNLSVATQLKLALLDNRLIKKMSLEAMEMFVNKNPLLFNMLPQNKKQEIVNNNPEFARLLSSDERQSHWGNPEFVKYFPPRNTCFKWGKHPVINYEETIRLATLGLDGYFELSSITESVQNSDILWEISKTIPQALSLTGIWDEFSYCGKIDHVKDMLFQKIKDPNILKAIELSGLFNHNFMYSIENVHQQLAVYKVITDEKVLARCKPEKIIDFIQNPNMDSLKIIVGETYGERARNILESRPGLTFENIPNLKIFDETIFDNFGEGVIHNQLSYQTKFSIVLADMANHPEKIKEYKKFERLTEGLFQDNVAGNEQKYKAFIELSGLISKIDESQMTTERKKALKLAISDLDFPDISMIMPERIEDLDSYVINRNKMCDDAAKKTTDIVKLKDILSRKFFGMRYENEINPNYTASTLSLKGMLHYYSIDNLLHDKRTYKSDLFTEDELDMLELAKIINEIDDPKILMQVYEALSERDSIIGPVEFQSIKQKIPMQFSRELVSQLLTPEKAFEMAERGEKGISIVKGKDGVDVIRLQGADFKIIINTMFGIKEGESNSKLEIPKGKDEAEIWKFFEQGCSTISTCLIEPNMLNSCGIDNTVINLGFCSIDPRLIIGMSHRDAHVSHELGKVDPIFAEGSVRMNYPEELLRKTAAQITGLEIKDPTHDYNEVTLYRREQDPAKISSENYAGRILPDYIVVYGKSNAYHRELAKAFSKNGRPIPIIEIYRKYYKDDKYFRASQKDEKHIEDKREDSQFVSLIRRLTEKQDIDGRE